MSYSDFDEKPRFSVGESVPLGSEDWEIVDMANGCYQLSNGLGETTELTEGQIINYRREAKENSGATDQDR